MTENQDTAAPAPSVHRLVVEISAGYPRGLRDDITFKGVCDAIDGAPCRMWCNDPDCREEATDDHDNHVLVDQGECGVIGTLNADPSMIPELYDGPETLLRSDFIELTQDIDGVTWHYGEETREPFEALVQLHGSLIALHDCLVEQGKDLAEYHGELREFKGRLDNYLEGLRAYKGSLDEYKNGLFELPARPEDPLTVGHEPSRGLTPNVAAAPSSPACADTCLHRCPECRLGLGSHLECDPLCTHHITPASR
jgi:hypothetical protein